MTVIWKNYLFAIFLGLLFLYAAFPESVSGQSESIRADVIGPGAYYQIGSLAIAGDTTVQLSPGSTRQFYVLSRHRLMAGVFYKVDAPAVWSVSPEPGAKIDKNGLLTVDPTAKHGTVFTVKVTVTIKEAWEEKGYSDVVEQKVIVFDKNANPLVGLWRQTHEVPCERKAVESASIRELEFRADGSFSVTRRPFEVYKDYWGKYAFDLKKRSIDFEFGDGNDFPADTDLNGSFKIEGKKLLLGGISLGFTDMGRKVCGMHFERF